MFYHVTSLHLKTFIFYVQNHVHNVYAYSFLFSFFTIDCADDAHCASNAATPNCHLTENICVGKQAKKFLQLIRCFQIFLDYVVFTGYILNYKAILHLLYFSVSIYSIEIELFFVF